MNVVTIGSLFLAGLMVLCSILLMATTIRQAAFSRRREIGIMRLVGASNLTIRLPFVMEMVLAALTGAGLAIVGLLGDRGLAAPARLGGAAGRPVRRRPPTSGSSPRGWSAFMLVVVGAHLLGHAAPLPARLSRARSAGRPLGNAADRTFHRRQSPERV